MKKSLTILVFLLLSAPAWGQTFIRGTVWSETGEELAGGNVLLEGTYEGATTDTAGRFGFGTEEVGAMTLRAVYMGYADATVQVELAGDTVEVELRLAEQFNELKAVSITAGSFEASDRSKSATLSSLDMVTTAGSAGDVYGALQTLPGTAQVGESGRLFVRGGTGEESKTFIDGQLVQAPYNSTAPGLPTRGRFSPFMFKGMIFSTGGYSAEYGDALSSVLLLETKDEDVEDRLDVGLLTVGASFAGTKSWESGSATLDGFLMDLTPYFMAAPQNMDWNRAPHSGNLAFSFRQKTGSSGMFKLYAGTSRSHANLQWADPNAATGLSDYDLTNDNQYINASWRQLLGEKWVLRTGVSATSNPDRVHFAEGDYTQDFRGLHGKVTATRELTAKVKLRMGGEWFGETVAERYANGAVDFRNGYGSQVGAGFVEMDAYANQRWGIRLGTRFAYNALLGETQLAPRFSTAYKINDHSQLSLAGGRFYQAPRTGYLLASPDLQSERADQLVLSYQSIRQSRTIRSEIYYKSYGRLVKFEGEMPRPTAISNAGDGYAYGLDVFFRDKKTIKNGDYWISYSYLETQRDFQDFPTAAAPAFASRHNLSVVYKHWFRKARSMVGGTFTYGSPRAYEDPHTADFMDARTPAYLSLDVNWSFLYRENIIFYSSVTNVPGFRQEFGRRYADQPDVNGHYASTVIGPPAPRFFLVGCFITFSRNRTQNQLDNIQ